MSSAAGAVQRSRVEHAPNACVHLFFLDKFTAFCCRDSFFHGGDEPALSSSGVSCGSMAFMIQGGR